MIIYGKKKIPEVGKCFKDSNGRFRFTIPKENDDEEVDIALEVKKIRDGVFVLDNKFCIQTSGNPKKVLVNNLFSNDDQIAIILNYQAHKTADNTAIFKVMQGWRDFFGDVLKEIRKYE